MATLKNLVDETTNIKNEIVDCHSNLSRILTSKNVEVSEEDNKLSSLIDKIEDIKAVKDIVAGISTILYSDNKSVEQGTTSYVVVKEYNHTFIKGSVKISFKCGAGNRNPRILLELERNGIKNTIKEVITSSNTYVTYEFDVDVEAGDKIILSVKSNSIASGPNSTFTSNFKVTCDYIF